MVDNILAYTVVFFFFLFPLFLFVMSCCLLRLCYMFVDICYFKFWFSPLLSCLKFLVIYFSLNFYFIHPPFVRGFFIPFGPKSCFLLFDQAYVVFTMSAYFVTSPFVSFYVSFI